MTDTRRIRRRPDGSIDTGYHVAQGRLRRSEAARDIARKSVGRSLGVLTPLIVLLGALPFLGGQG